jgi:hypothetical protein
MHHPRTIRLRRLTLECTFTCSNPGTARILLPYRVAAADDQTCIHSLLRLSLLSRSNMIKVYKGFS